MRNKLRFGVLGGRRGRALAHGARANGVEVAALCDRDTDLLNFAAQEIGGDVQKFTDFSKMLDSDIDAVLIANYATEHLEPVKLALRAGKHVLSECMACFTMAEAVELIEAVEKSGKIYMLAENYPYFAQNIRMKKLYEENRIGKFIYGEGEYVHPISAAQMAELYSGPGHWRAWFSPLYYCTHSMGPIMNITGTRPVSVNGFAFPYDCDDPQQTMSLRTGDQGGVLMCKMDNEAVVKLLPWSALRDHGQRYRICGNRGTLEWNQGDSRLRMRTEPFDAPDAESYNCWSEPNFPPEHLEALNHGHGGGDYFTSFYFTQAIREGRQPYMDVYRAVDMTVIGIQGYRSALNNSNTCEIPDFHDPAMREKYRHDNWNNDPRRRSSDMPYGSVRGEIVPGDAAHELFRLEREKFIAQMRKKTN